MISSKTIEIIVLGKDQASKVLSGVGSAVSGLGSVAAGVATGGLALAAAAVVGLGAAAVGATIGITKLAFAAADIEGTRLTFERLTHDLGGSTAALKGLKEATRDMVSEADLMAASNKFLTMGITETAKETAYMAKMATQLGLAMGTDATKSMEDFALMMANQSIPRLDTFGISSAAVRKRIDELKEATEGLSKEEAFKIAVMEQGAIAMEKVGEQGESATATTLRWKAAIDDLKTGIGRAFIPALEAIRKPVLDLVDRYGPRVIEWANIAGQWLGEKIPQAIDWLEAVWMRYWPEASSILTNFWNTIRPGLIWVRDMLQSFTTNYLPHLRNAWDILKEGFQTISEVYNRELKPALERLWEALGIGTGKSDEVAGAFGSFMGIMLEIQAAGIINLLVAGIKALSWAMETGRHWGITLRDTFHSMVGVFDRIRHQISVVIEKFWELVNAIKGFTLPWWLTPGSPTPLETGLLGIGKALSSVSGAGLPLGGMTLAGAGATIGRGATIQIINNFGPGSVRSNQDILDLSDAIVQNLELRGVVPVL